MYVGMLPVGGVPGKLYCQILEPLSVQLNDSTKKGWFSHVAAAVRLVRQGREGHTVVRCCVRARERGATAMRARARERSATAMRACNALENVGVDVSERERPDDV